MSAPAEFRVFAVGGLPEVRPGDDLAALIQTALTNQETPLEPGDVLLVTQKIISKAEGRLLPLAAVEPRAAARDFAARWDKDPRQVEVVLREARRIVRMERGLIIAETRHGWICANAGVDQSNVGSGDAVTLLPEDPSASAAALRRGLRERGAADVAVIVSDTFGRPWREGLTNVAIGLSGLNPLVSYLGRRDPAGYDLQVTVIALADELAAAAEPVMNKLDRVPAAVVRGLAVPLEEYDHSSLIRPPELDLFR